LAGRIVQAPMLDVPENTKISVLKGPSYVTLKVMGKFELCSVVKGKLITLPQRTPLHTGVALIKLANKTNERTPANNKLKFFDFICNHFRVTMVYKVFYCGLYKLKKIN